MLLTVDLHKDFVNVEGVAIALVFSLQAARVNGTELYAPKADCFATYGDPSFGKQVFNISVAEIESVVEPDGVEDDIR